MSRSIERENLNVIEFTSDRLERNDDSLKKD